jgi:asparagine N-glycosylation enzyme membrane subunit Stt3
MFGKSDWWLVIRVMICALIALALIRSDSRDWAGRWIAC